MRLRTPDAPDGEGVNKWQRTGISDGLLTPIAPAAEAAPVSLPEGRAPPRKADLLYAVTVAALTPSLAFGVRALRHRMIPIGLIKCNLVVPAVTRSRS